MVVVIGKVAVVAPAATRTYGGRAAIPVLAIVRSTSTPPAGAAPVSVTVPVTVVPAFTVEALSVRLLMVTVAFCRVSAVERLMPVGSVAERVTVVVAATGLVSTRVWPDVVVIVIVGGGGTVVVSVDETGNCHPPEGAFPVSVAVPVRGTVPPMNVLGATPNTDIDGGSTVIVAWRTTAPCVAVIVSVAA